MGIHKNQQINLTDFDDNPFQLLYSPAFPKMSKKRTMGNKIQIPKLPNEDEEQLEDQILQENEDDILNFPECEQQVQENRNKQLLEVLGQIAVNQKKDCYRLTWKAFYCLKKQEIDLNQLMQDEIQKIKDKYELQKQSIYTEISQAALGQYIRPPKQQNKHLSTVYKRIPNFWIVVFTKAGIFDNEISVDLDCLRKLERFTCEISQKNFSLYTLKFAFNEEPIYFTNKVLQMTIDMSAQEDDQQPFQISNPLTYKLPRIQQSFFTQLFDNTNLSELRILVTEINQSYRNSLYFYFSQYHSACNTSEADEEFKHFEFSGKKVKSDSNSPQKLRSNDRTNNMGHKL